jgi:hypothetical protein
MNLQLEMTKEKTKHTWNVMVPQAMPMNTRIKLRLILLYTNEKATLTSLHLTQPSKSH